MNPIYGKGGECCLMARVFLPEQTDLKVLQKPQESEIQAGILLKKRQNTAQAMNSRTTNQA